MYDFDTLIDRKNTESLKWSCPESCKSSLYKDIIPMWIADNDFASPPEVVKALVERASHPIYGYSKSADDIFAAYAKWMKTRYSLDVKVDSMVFSPGIVPAIATAIRAFTNLGDGIVIMPPVYHPFKNIIEKNKRKPIEAKLIIKDGHYEADLAAIDAACAKAKILILCSPHNPVGRVWTLAELKAITEIAKKHDNIIISDEIHGDLVFEKGRMVSALALDSSIQNRLIAAWAPSKTFNIAGLQASIISLPNKDMREAFVLETAAAATGSPNCMAITAAVSAYNHGGPWLDKALSYVHDNYKELVTGLSKTKLVVYPLEGTLLAWIDFRGAGLSGNVGSDVIEKAGVWLDAGSRFGASGDGFARLNLACPRATLKEAIARLAKAFS